MKSQENGREGRPYFRDESKAIIVENMFYRHHYHHWISTANDRIPTNTISISINGCCHLFDFNFDFKHQSSETPPVRFQFWFHIIQLLHTLQVSMTISVLLVFFRTVQYRGERTHWPIEIPVVHLSYKCSSDDTQLYYIVKNDSTILLFL